MSLPTSWKQKITLCLPRFGARPLLAAAAVAVCCTGAAACGRSTPADSSAASAPARTASSVSNAGGVANDGEAGRNAGDQSVLRLGRPTAAEARAVDALVERYYAAMVARDGAAGCALLYSAVSESVAEDYGVSKHTPVAFHGKTCAVVLSKVFAALDRRLASHKLALRRVTRVLVDGNRGVALLDFGGKSPGQISVHREGGVWKVDEMSGSGFG